MTPQLEMWIFKDGLKVWISWNSESIPSKLPKPCLGEKATNMSLLGLPPLLAQQYDLGSFCQTCHELDHLIKHCPSLNHGSVHVLLGDVEQLCGSQSCSCCQSIVAALPENLRENCPNWLVTIEMGPYMWIFKLRCGNTLLIEHGQKSFQNHLEQAEFRMDLIPLAPIFPDRKFGRAFDSYCLDLQLVKHWLSKCNLHAGSCTKIQQKGLPRLPSIYLIDVDASCIISTAHELRYVALSYVWGRTETLKTTMQNLQSLQNPGALSEPHYYCLIPNTIKDAMRLTSALNERYLWVDSLCIVQDDKDTLQIHLNAMPTIYANAYFTIVAADGNNSAHGLRGLDGGSHIRNVIRSRISLPSTTLMQFVHRSADGNNSTWASRAWTFQEALFSKRMLIFDGLLSWVCSRTQYYEEVEIPPSWYDYNQSLELRRAFLTGAERLRDEIYSATDLPKVYVWQELVELFQRRELTYSSDILKAFAGITAVLQPSFPGGFHFGLPEMFFDLALLWQPRSSPVRRKTTGCDNRNLDFPSWSWAGRKGEIDVKLWSKCFNHIFLHSGPQGEDYIQCIPLVKWYKKSASTQKLHPIQNSSHMFESLHHQNGPSLPHFWSSLDGGKGYIFKNQDGHGKRLRWPILTTNNEAEDRDTYEPYLYFSTVRARLVLGPDIGYDPKRPAISLYGKAGEWAGILHVTPGCKLSESKDKAEICELIVISRGKVLNDSHSRNLWREGSVGKSQFGGCVLEEWTLSERPKDSSCYDFYNVLCIGRSSGIAYRRALGRVVKEVWEDQDFEEIEVILG